MKFLKMKSYIYINIMFERSTLSSEITLNMKVKDIGIVIRSLSWKIAKYNNTLIYVIPHLCRFVRKMNFPLLDIL